MATKDEVRQVAQLARLSVDENRLESVTHEFNAILEYVKTLEAVDVDSVEPMSHVHGSVNIFRDDAVIHTLTHEQGLRNAPDRFENCFRVPLVITTQHEE